jgi:heavy metal sensor kinase
MDPLGVAWATGEGLDPGYDAGEQRWVEVFATSGERLYVRGVPRHAFISAALPAPTQADGFSKTRTPAGAHVRLLTAARQIGDVPVFIRVARSEDEIRDQWKALTFIFLLTIPLAMLAAGGVGRVLAGRALAPIARMAARARTITADRLHERLPVENPHDELGDLALVFNRTIERLEDSFDRLKRFTADASHELRTPLTALRTVGEVGLREPRTPPQYRDIVGSMLEEADRLTRLVEDLLALSRFDSGRVRPAPEPVDLGVLATEVASHLGVLAEEKGIDLRVRTEGHVVALADRPTLRQAVINVLDNAIKYSPAGKTVELSVASGGGLCVLTVSDEGPGIPREHHARIFDRFYRVDKARTRDIDGTGLGLAIAQWAVAASHGEITVDSVEGRGSRFTIRVPPP